MGPASPKLVAKLLDAGCAHGSSLLSDGVLSELTRDGRPLASTGEFRTPCSRLVWLIARLFSPEPIWFCWLRRFCWSAFRETFRLYCGTLIDCIPWNAP